MSCRSALRMNDAGQGLFRLIEHLGPMAYETAVLLTTNRFDITRAALQYGLQRKCGRCLRPVKEQEALRGCNACVAALRQRVHRMQDRLLALMGDAAPRSRHRRPTVMFGADRERGGEGRGETIYERARAEGAEALEL